MSGTSMDGLDCLLVDIRLSSQFAFDYKVLDFKTYPYSAETRHLIRQALEGDREKIRTAHFQLGEVFAFCVERFLEGREIDIAGSHGQTVAHEDGMNSLQIGDVTPLYDLLKVPVVHDFRTADIQAGGNGAPLVPFMDWLLYRKSARHTITLNIGGIANLTHIQPQSERISVIGFDTGPGMALIDEGAELLFGADRDDNGVFSSKGKIEEKLFKQLMNHPFIHKPPPKSSGRHEFGREYLTQLLKNYPDIPPENFLRTLVAFTAKSVSVNITKHLKFPPENSRLVLAGGGAHHPLLLQDLRKYVAIKEIILSGEAGPDPDWKEALLIAVLAVARIKNLPANMIGVTGAAKETVLGRVFPG